MSDGSNSGKIDGMSGAVAAANEGGIGGASRRDIAFLVADKNMDAMVRGFLLRDAFHLSLGCGLFRFDPRVDLAVAAGNNDPGLYKKGAELARGFQQSHDHLVLMLDAASTMSGRRRGSH